MRALNKKENKLHCFDTNQYCDLCVEYRNFWKIKFIRFDTRGLFIKGKISYIVFTQCFCNERALFNFVGKLKRVWGYLRNVSVEQHLLWFKLKHSLIINANLWFKLKHSLIINTTQSRIAKREHIEPARGMVGKRWKYFSDLQDWEMRLPRQHEVERRSSRVPDFCREFCLLSLVHVCSVNCVEMVADEGPLSQCDR